MGCLASQDIDTSAYLGYISPAPIQTLGFEMADTQLISPFLWFDGQAAEAAGFYVATFPDSRILSVEELTDGPAEGSVLVEFSLNGQRFTALDGGPMFRFSPAISFVVHCADQEEVDYYWRKLSEGGAAEQCGWLRDRFGVSWQVAPEALGQLLEQGGSRVMDALLKMGKIDLAQLQAAAQPD